MLSKQARAYRPCWVVLLGLIALAGCGQAAAPVCQVTGKVLVKGKPAAELCVRFHALDDEARKLLPSAVWTNADGTFTISLPSPGQYAITACWPSVTVVQGESIEGPDRLGSRFIHMTNPISKSAFVAGENQLPELVLR